MDKVVELMETVDTLKYGNFDLCERLANRCKGYKEAGIGMQAPPIIGKNVLDNSDFNFRIFTWEICNYRFFGILV